MGRAQASTTSGTCRRRSLRSTRRCPTEAPLPAESGGGAFGVSSPAFPGPSSRPVSALMHAARRTHGFTESVIRGMTRLASEHDAINLAQGFPNFPAPDVLKEAAARAIRDDV